jgi:hypothetical protein
MAIMGSLLESKKFVIRMIGALFFIGVCGTGVWIILILLALSTEEEISFTLYTYLTQLANDYLFVDML